MTRQRVGLVAVLAFTVLACTSRAAAPEPIRGAKSASPRVARVTAQHAGPAAGAAAAKLEALRRAGDLAGQRRHAWALFARLVAAGDPAQPPVFERWYTEDETFAASGTAAPAAPAPWPRFVATRPVAGIAPGSGGADPADAPVLAWSLYDAAAYRHIRALRLYDAAELDRLRAAGAPDALVAGNRTVPPFPAEAVVIKTAWWPVAGDLPTAMPVWDPERNPPREGGNPYPGWSRVVVVDPSGRAGAATLAVDFAGRSFRAARRVPLADIPHVPLDARAAAALRREPAARKAMQLALGRDIRAGDHLALVAVHVATREVADWIWATAWWHDAPERGTFAAGRPPELRGAWRHFLLDVAFDEVAPAEADGTPHVAFNPWLESRFPDGGHGGGTASNCLTCHRRASWPVTAFLPVTRGAPDLARDPAYAPGRLRTQFLWSIALRARRDGPLPPR